MSLVFGQSRGGGVPESASLVQWSSHWFRGWCKQCISFVKYLAIGALYTEPLISKLDRKCCF